MHHFITLIALTALLAPAAAMSCEPAPYAAEINAAEIDAVRAQRAAFNAAIAAEDLDTIAAVLHENVLLVTGTASEVFRGRAAQLALWQEDFAAAERAVYLRTPDCVRVSPAFPVALESGRWRGEWQGDPARFAAGVYSAKWRQVDGAWLLEAELFATEACGGDFCPATEEPAP
jgi:ketosteroid isomerase-like protein